MNRFSPLAAAAALALLPLGVAAQSPQPPPSPQAPLATVPPMSPIATSAPGNAMPATTSAPATAAPAATTPHPTAAPKSAAARSYKKIPNGSMSFTDLRYALTHPLQEANKVRKMKTISFDKLRVYRLSSGLKSMLKVGDANADIPALAVLGPGVEVAQVGLPGSNGSNSPIAYLQYVLANINVSNALNNVNVLNNSNIGINVALKDVLNGNKISIGQVAGIFVNGLGIITTITK